MGDDQNARLPVIQFDQFNQSFFQLFVAHGLNFLPALSDITSMKKLPENLDLIVNAKELCRLLGLSERTLRSSDIPRLRLSGRLVRYHLRTVLRHLGGAV